MASARSRFLSSAGWMLTLGGLCGLSCGSPYEGVHRFPSYGAEYDVPEAPQEVVAQIERCARQGASRLLPNTYSVLLDVRASEDGQVTSAQVKDSLLGDAGIEGCMVQALRASSFAASLVGLPAGRRLSGGVSGPEARGLLGNPAVLVPPAAKAAAAAAAGTALSPIVITIGLVTLLVVVTVYVVYKVGESAEEESERERCKKVQQACNEKCSDSVLPTKDYAASFWKCKRKCEEAENCWGVK